MNKNIVILIVIIILILIFGGFILLRNNPSDSNIINNTGPKDAAGNTIFVGDPPASDQTNKPIMVTYNGLSFSPSSITVKKGDLVSFVNQSSGNMEVASDPHPTHVNYPEFDQGDGSQKGNIIYTFTFEKVGTWGYHNHTNPSAKGTVVVNP